MSVIERIREKFRYSMGEVEASDLRSQFGKDTINHVQRIDSCQPGSEIEIIGTVKSMSIRPQEKNPACEIEIYDGSGVITVIWLGRRKIPGIVTGRIMKISGRLTCNTQHPTIYNPKYELRPLQR